MLTVSSGPRLMADRQHFQKSMVEMPGEGKHISSKEEGTKIWRSKTHRKYYEPVIKPHRETSRDRRPTDLDAIEYRSDRSDRSDMRSLRSHRSQRPYAVTDDQKSVTAEDLDKIFLERDPKGFYDLNNSESYSYIPTVRDVAIQCNRKKSNRHLLKATSSDSNDSYVRVIKPSNDGLVTAYSDVPHLKSSSRLSHRTPLSKHEVWDKTPDSDVIYSKVDKSKKKLLRNDDGTYVYGDINNNYPQVIYKTPVNERRAPSGLSNYSKYSGSEYSTNTNRTLKNKTKGIGFKFSTGVDGPEVNLPKTSPKLRSRSLNRFEAPKRDWRITLNDSLPPNYKKEDNQEVLEETISISNASSDDLQPYERGFDEYLEPKPHFRELESKRRDISMSYELPTQRPIKERDVSPSIRSRTLQDYRKGINSVTYATDNESPYSTLSRYDNIKKGSKPTDFTPPPRQAFTLDRRLLKERQKRLEAVAKSGDVNPRLHKSTVDLTEHSRSDDLRGGLATAYKNRQPLEKRTSSLNRMSAIREGRMSPSNSVPIRYLSHTHLNSTGNSANSSSDSDTLNRAIRALNKPHYIHDREPIVMYIPAVSHHNKRAEDDTDRLSSILRPTSRTGSTASSKKGKKLPKSSASSDLTPTKPRNYPPNKYSNYGTSRAPNDEELDQIVELKDTKNFGKLNKKSNKSILSRRHSIPKDTKFPWLQRLKSKVKFRE